jgi:hypothetical protein
MREGFEKELSALLNYHSQEQYSDTPDFILAQFLIGCLEQWNKSVQRREEWYGRELCKDVTMKVG